MSGFGGTGGGTLSGPCHTTPFGRIGLASSFMTAARPWQGARTLGGYGVTEAESTSESTDYLQQAGAFAGGYANASDARIALSTIQAKIDSDKAILAQMPKWLVPARLVLQRDIAILSAKKTALQDKFGIQVEGENATRNWRTIGMTGGVVGVGIGLALIALLVTMTVKKARTNGKRRNKTPRYRRTNGKTARKMKRRKR